MKKLGLICILFCLQQLLWSQGSIKYQIKNEVLFADSNLYEAKESPTIKPISYLGKDIAYHAFYNHSNILHAVFIKKEDQFVFEEYAMSGAIIAKGKLMQNMLYCVKDTHNILSPITLKVTEKHITCYYSLLKVGKWEIMDEEQNIHSGNYFNGKKDGVWKYYINKDYLSNIQIYRMDSLLQDSNVHHVSNYSKDSLSHLLGGLWYASILDKNTHTMILKREVKDYSYDYSLKMLADNNFERNKQFIVANDPETSMKGNWEWNADNSLTLNAHKQQIRLQFLYVDKKEIIIKEIHQPKI